MKASAFKVGDIVRIRQWDDMVEEFGEEKQTGSIVCERYFTPPMKKFCGKRARLTGVRTQDKNGVATVDLLFLDDTSTEAWQFSTDMLEPAIDTEGEDIIDVEPEELQPITPESYDTARLLAELGGLF